MNKIDEINAELDQVKEELFYEKRSSEENHVKFVEQYELVELLQKEIERLNAEIERKDEALRFYADEDTWRMKPDGEESFSCAAIEDIGDTAREAL
ncbi:hypothetical protein GOL43_34275 [Sinorhizobium medicae]|nr:hypothetical protein [Sinorhizobium medicae]